MTSVERPFTDPTKAPDDKALAREVGSTFPYYHKICDLSTAFKHQWHFYKNSGWLLKIHDKKKALFYVIPLVKYFKVNLTIREGERWAFLKDDDLLYLKAQIEEAKQYPEGYLLMFTIKDDASFNEFLPLAEKLIKLRLNREASSQ